MIDKKSRQPLLDISFENKNGRKRVDQDTGSQTPSAAQHFQPTSESAAVPSCIIMYVPSVGD
jgi:hypothetical protein